MMTPAEVARLIGAHAAPLVLYARQWCDEPDAGRLDRDALLYAAGRASARPNRSWIALTVGLALVQPLYGIGEFLQSQAEVGIVHLWLCGGSGW